jgi:hypothetical protein
MIKFSPYGIPPNLKVESLIDSLTTQSIGLNL